MHVSVPGNRPGRGSAPSGGKAVANVQSRTAGWKTSLCGVAFYVRAGGAGGLSKRGPPNRAFPVQRFDMSEYTEKHTVAKLIGSPAGCRSEN